MNERDDTSQPPMNSVKDELRMVMLLRDDVVFHQQCPRNYLGEAARRNNVQLEIVGTPTAVQDWVRWLMESEPVPVRGRNIVQIGIHGFVYSDFDAKYAKAMGNTIFGPRDVRALGINEVAKHTLSNVNDGRATMHAD